MHHAAGRLPLAGLSVRAIGEQCRARIAAPSGVKDGVIEDEERDECERGELEVMQRQVEDEARLVSIGERKWDACAR